MIEGNYMSITRDEVLWGYRMILGRDPESEEALVANMDSDDLYHLQKRFMSSEEFLLKRKNFLSERTVVKPRVAPFLSAQEVEYSATLGQLVDCVAKVRAQYAKVGPTEPHFAVAVDPSETLDSIDANVSQFWATGHAQAKDLLQPLEPFGLTELKNKTAVEFGCSVGRLSLGLAGKFKQVHCFDVSDSQIILAKKASVDAGVYNCTFHLSSGNPFAALESTDFFYSKNTFQHYPPPIIHQFIRNALRSLKTDGLALFQVPTSQPDYSFSIANYLLKDGVPELSHCLPQHSIFSLIAEAKCELLEVKEELIDFPAGAVSNVFLVRKPGAKQAKKLMLPVLLS
jgi:SAM-dependent methyltransferase